MQLKDKPHIVKGRATGLWFIHTKRGINGRFLNWSPDFTEACKIAKKYWEQQK